MATVGGSAALAGGPIGELEVSGQVRIGQQASDESISIGDTTYGWFSGDRINTRSGHAVLSLDEGGTFGFGENTEASLSSDDGRISVDLDSGVMLYAIEGEAAELAVASGEYRFTTRSGGTRPVPVASDAPVSTGMIEVLDDGEVRVTVYEGKLMAADASGTMHYQVETGQAVEFAGTEPRQVEVQAGALDDDPGFVAWIQRNPGWAALIASGVAYGIYRAQRSSSDPDSVSP